MADLYSRINKDDAVVLLVDHQTGLMSGLYVTMVLMNSRTMF